MSNNTNGFERLVTIIDELREKCPWDRKQTIQSLRQLSIEELYELTDAISEENWAGIKEELGDLLLHIIFYAKIAGEQQQFSIEDVINGICEKLIARHPHVYGNITVKNEEEVKQNWEKLKLKEGKKSILGGVPASLPALVKAMRLQEKAKQAGFEWENKTQVWEKVQEETQELQEALMQQQQQKVEEELGDLFFSLINYARFLHVDAAHALEQTNKKFIRRFQLMEKQAAANGQQLSTLSLQQMDAIWDTIKQAEKPA